MTQSSIKITVSCVVNAPVNHVWTCWTAAEHMVNWNFASDDWHCPAATNDLQVGGKFVATMAAKDGSMSFDFIGTYDEIATHKYIRYHGTDNRVVEVSFEATENGILITETFDAETVNPVEMQQAGWQAIMNNFKAYAEK
jgi:uncharacterized protein YndB with AHSA1/START domain